MSDYYGFDGFNKEGRLSVLEIAVLSLETDWEKENFKGNRNGEQMEIDYFVISESLYFFGVTPSISLKHLLNAL